MVILKNRTSISEKRQWVRRGRSCGIQELYSRLHVVVHSPWAGTTRKIASRIVARGMIAKGTAGRMVHLGSIMGLSGGGLYPNLAYHTSKGAIVNATRAMACEWAADGLRVNSVAPTWVDTPFLGALKSDPEAMRRIADVTPLGRVATAEEVADAVCFLLSKQSAMITGHTLPVDGGFLSK